ncbi:MAG: RHS repeat-associated core domain-containing protein [Vicinamibacteria bacterium]
MRGTVAGSQAITLDAGTARLSLPTGALDEDSALSIEVPTALSPYLPNANGLTPLAEVVLDFGGKSLLTAAELSVESGAASEGDTLLVARVVRIDDIPRFETVALAEVVAARVVSRAANCLTGVAREGRYAIFRSAAAIGLVTGVVTAGGSPVKASVEASAWPFMAFGRTDGRYTLVAPAGSATLTARVAGTSLVGSASVVVPAPDAVNVPRSVTLDLALAGSVTPATVTPADGAVAVEPNAPLEIASPIALNPATAISANVALVKLPPESSPGDPEQPVAVRLVLSGSAKTLSVIPQAALAFGTRYRLNVSGLVDAFGGAVAVPATTFRTRDDVAPEYQLDAIVFSFPDENGLVKVTAPAGTLPPGTSILIINAGSGGVATFTAENDGSLGTLVPTDFPASIDDQLFVTVTDPLGNSITFTRSKYVNETTGETAIGPGGGTVTGPGGVELRIPEGALDAGVRFKIEALTAQQLEDLYPGQRPNFGTKANGHPSAVLGGGIRIDSPDKPTLKKYAKLAFPLPDFQACRDSGACDAPPAGQEQDVYFHVLRRLEGPDGKYVFEALDDAFVEGSGASARVATASPPFSGYLNSFGGFDPLGALIQVTSSYLFLMWSYESLLPGRPLPGVVTGKVFRQRFVKNVPGQAPAEPVYDGLADALVAMHEGIVGDGDIVALSQPDGTYTLADPQYTGGVVDVTAIVGATPEAELARTPAFQANPQDFASTGLRYYRNVATANITFAPKEPPPPPSALAILIFDASTGADVQGLVTVGTPLLVTFASDATVTSATIDGQPYSVAADTATSRTDDYRLVGSFTPEQPGTYTVAATALPAFGAAITASRTLRAITAGGAIDNLPGEAPQVTSVGPDHGSVAVPTDVLPQISFTEPVVNLRETTGQPNVRLVVVGTNAVVPALLLGVDPAGVPFEVTDPAQAATSVSVQPLAGLKFRTRYRIEATSAIQDQDVDALGSPTPRPLVPFESEFTTDGPKLLGSAGDVGSAGIVALGDRVYLTRTNSFVNGSVLSYDVSSPTLPTPGPESEVFAPRPYDIAGEELNGESLLAVATGSTHVTKPASVLFFDAREHDIDWVGAASVAASAAEGFISRIATLRGTVYAATVRKGIQVVERARNLEGLTALQLQDARTAINTDGRGFGQQHVVRTIPVPQKGGGQHYFLNDIEAADVGGQPLVVVAGEMGLVTADPLGGARLFPQGDARGDVTTGDGSYTLGWGLALALARLGGLDTAVVVSKTHIATVDLTDPTRPRVVGRLDLTAELEGLTPVDVAVREGVAVVTAQNTSGTSGFALSVSLLDPTQPSLTGRLSDFTGRLAIGTNGLLHASARMSTGGSSPLGGVHTAALDPRDVSACTGLLRLETERVVQQVTIDPLNGTRCGTPSQIVFTVCRAAQVGISIDGQPLVSSISGGGGLPVTLIDVPLNPGTYAVTVPPDALGTNLTAMKPFSVSARPADGPIETAPGTLVNDIRNRSVLPVGHTFVKGVDLFDGHVVRQATDVKLPGRHLGLEITRTYSSAGRGEGGVIGAGWSWNYDSWLSKGECGLYTVSTADGSSQTFRSSDGQTFTPQKGYHTRLERDGPGLLFTDKSGTKHRFRGVGPGGDSNEGPWRLQEIEEPHGDRIVPRYDGIGRVTRIDEMPKDASDAVRSLHLEYERVLGVDRLARVSASTRVNGVSGGLGLEVEYAYDADTGNLLTATRSGRNLPGGASADAPLVEKYEYSADDVRDRHQLTAAVDPNDNRTEYRYYRQTDTLPGETPALLVLGKEELVRTVVEFPSRDLPTPPYETAFSYDMSRAASDLIWTTTVRDARGNDTVYLLNGYGAPREIQEPLGRRTSMTWAPDDILKTSERDALERVTDFSYDARGNLTGERISSPTGELLAETTYRYDARFNKLEFKRDAEGRETRFEIDPETGDLRSTTDAVGNHTVYDYDAAGQLLATTDPRGYRTEFRGHDTFGNPTSILDPLGNAGLRHYDDRGRLFLESDGRGHETRTLYDGLDRPVEVRQVGGRPGSPDVVTSTAYHNGGQPREVRNGLIGRTVYDLDGLNRVTKVTTHLGNPGDGGPYVAEMRYDENGNKVWEKDRRDVIRVLRYDALNRLDRVEIVAGAIPGPTGEVATYAYDLVGNKTAETDVAQLRTEFRYDGLYRVKERLLPEQNPVTDQPYSEQIGYDRVGNVTSQKDANGRETVTEYDGLNRPTSVVRDAGTAPDRLNLETRFFYDDPEATGSHVNKSREIDVARGLETRFVYDRLNRETTRTVVLAGEDGDPGTSNVTYETVTKYLDGTEHAVEVEDPRGSITRSELDGLDHVSRRVVDTEGLALESRFAYDALGNLATETNPRGFTTITRHDSLGRLQSRTDANQKTASFDYDGEGLKTRATDRRNVRHDFQYDNLGRLTRDTLVPSFTAVGWSHVTRYDDLARKRVEVDARNNETTFDLDGLNRVVKVTDPYLDSAQTRWDGVNKIAESDKRGYLTTYRYDGVNRLVEVKDPAPFGAQLASTTYDDVHNRVIETDRRLTQKVTQLDPLGRVVSVTRDGVRLERNEYDGNGNKTVAEDALGRVTRFDYDGANRLTARTDGFGTPEQATTAYTYDENGNKTAEIDPRSTEQEPSMRYVYDALDRVAQSFDGEGNRTGYGYDEEGNRTLVEEPLLQVTEYEYEELGKLTKVTQPAATSGGGRPVTEYGYDESRNRVSQTDARQKAVSMTYDKLDRVEKRIQDGGLETTYNYDEDGREKLVRDPKGQTVTSDYDELGRLKSKSWAFAAGTIDLPWRYLESAAYSYDPNGNLTRVEEAVASGTDPPGAPVVTARTYDRLDRLTSETTALMGGERTVGYEYHANGLKRAVIDPDLRRTEYGYDGKNRLASATTDFDTPQAATTSYLYWPDDLLKEVRYANGTTATHAYDRADRLTSLSNTTATGSLVSSYVYGYDANGNRLSQVETNGGATETTSYGYDALNRLKSVTYPADASFPDGRRVEYGYDAVGNRERETDTDLSGAVLADKQGIFDSLNRLTALVDLVDPAGSTAFTWDRNGNQLSKTVGEGAGATTTTNVYDVRDRLVEVQQSSSILSRFAYDFEGRRSRKIGSEGVRQYVYDDTSLYLEYDDVSASVAKYDYGSDRLISLTRRDEPRRYFHLDGLRSVTNLTSDDGSTAASYHLDAWGNYRFPTELTASRNRFGFTGYQLDSETGLYNAKARYFDPQLGRFLTQDSYLGQIDNAPSLHRYFYAHANPTRYVDPTGHIARQMLDESINRSTDQSSNWFTAGAKAFFKEAGYQTLNVISFGALHRQDKLVDQNLAGQISDAEYYGKTGVNVVLSGTQAAMTLGTGGAMGATRTAAVAWGAAGGIAGQGISDIGEVYGTETKNLEDIRARDYLLAGAMGAAGGYAGYRARGPARAGPSQAEKAGVIAEQGQNVTPDAPAAAASSPSDVNVQPALKPAGQTPAANRPAAQHAAWGQDLDAINATVERLGRRALKRSGGNWQTSEALFERYLGGVERRFGRTGSQYGVEIQPAALPGGERVPSHIYLEKLDGSGLVHDRWGDLKLVPYPGSRRMDAAIIDRTSSGPYHRAVSGFDITLNARKPSVSEYYQEAFPFMQDFFDIRLRGRRR